MLFYIIEVNRMKGEKSKLILVYFLMLLVIGLIVALTFIILNNSPKEEEKESTANTTPTVDVNPYPTISDECTFNLTVDEYNALTGPGCKGGYSRYNVNNLNIDGKQMNIVIIYSDTNGNKAGLYVNDRKVANTITNVASIKFGIFSSKLFILDNNNNESNVLVFNADSTKVYDLKEILDSSKITDPILNQIISSTTINPNSFNFTDSYFTFQAQLVDGNNVATPGSTYQVTFTSDDFSKPTFVSQN